MTLTSFTNGGNAATRFHDIWFVLFTTDESIAPVAVGQVRSQNEMK